MKQLLQDLNSGELVLEELPSPKVRAGYVLIQTSCSLISSGTERALGQFAKAGYLAKARQQPERARDALEKVRIDGLIPTLTSIGSKLDQPIPLGYCNVGRVLAVGPKVEGLTVGDRVASNGHHAELVLVPKHLCVRVPDQVSDEAASFTVIGSIALQGIRLLQPTLGETVAVMGLGLVGLIAVQLLHAAGARVIGFDTNSHRTDIARQLGVEAHHISAAGAAPVEAAVAFSSGEGVDGVLVTAASNSNDVIHQAAQMSRKRGRIILTGVVGLHLRRADFYEKELRFQVSCSYGPGRYDERYEQQGIDYPLSYVRWTEHRNFGAIVDLLADGRLRVDRLITERFPFERAIQAYDAVVKKDTIAITLEYLPQTARTLQDKVVYHRTPRTSRKSQAVIAVIGAGAFSQGKLIPAVEKTGARLKWIASSGGLSGGIAARRFSIEASTTDVGRVLDDPEVNSVVIATRHDSHASLVISAIEAGKSVFVEKPLCLKQNELARIRSAYERAMRREDVPPVLMVGYNRRFAPLTKALVTTLAKRRNSPLAMTMLCNAGPIGVNHWVHDTDVGGGRILGEACHFVDLLHYISGSRIGEVYARALREQGGQTSTDTACISLWFDDHSIGQVQYFSNGARRYPKERLEVFSDGRVFRIDNFRLLTTVTRGKTTKRRLLVQDKGHDSEMDAFVRAVRQGKESPIAFESIVHTTMATLAVVESMTAGRPFQVKDEAIGG